MSDYIPKIMKQGAEITSPSLMANMILTNNAINQQEAVRQSQEAERQTNTTNAINATNTAITNANNAATNANTKATLADQKANLADQKATLANNAATNASTLAELLESETLKIYKNAVGTYSELSTTYPTPQKGWTVAVTSQSVSYRWNGTSWVNLGALFGDQHASGIMYNNTSSGLDATDVQDAIDRLVSNKINKTDIINNDITGGTDKPASAEIVKTLGTEIDSLKTIKTATITTTWIGSTAPFTQDITVNGITALDTPIVDLVLSSTLATAQNELRQWSRIDKIVTSANKITVYCYTSKPTIALNIQLKGV